MSDYDLELAAEEEIERACDMSWRELSGVMPWGDAFEGFTPGGAEAHFERSYLWAEQPGGDILCEVAVYPDPQSYERAARRSRLIRKG